MMEEQMAMQKAELEKMMRRGGTDPWAVDYNKELHGKDLSDPTETMKDNAAEIGTTSKSFSF